MAALFGLGLLAAFMVLLHGAFSIVDAKAEGAFNQVKELLTLVVGLLGTVLGYYFGKIPAEKSAESARSEAASARNAAQNAEARLKDSDKALETARERVGAALALAKRPPTAGGGESPREAATLVSLLEDARERLVR